MRTFAAALFFVLVAQPAFAQQSVLDQVGGANALLYQSLDSDAFGSGAYFDKLTAGLDGKWFDAAVLRDKLGDPEAAAAEATRVCGLVPVEMTASPPWTITARRGSYGVFYDTLWTYLSGSRFSAYSDPKGIIAYYNLNETEQYALGKSLVILGNQLIDLYRPSPDVLIAVRDTGGSEVYARCPGEDGAVAATETAAEIVEPQSGIFETLDAALATQFDHMFPKVKSGDARQTFVACVHAALSGLKPEDLQILIDAGFNLPSDVGRRFEEEYPTIGEDAEACFNAAQAAVAR